MQLQPVTSATPRHLRGSDAENEPLKVMLVKARMDLEAAKADLAAERERGAAARAEMVQMMQELDRAVDDMRREHAAVLAEQTAVCTALPLDELLTVFSTLRRSQTGSELMSAFMTGLGREFSRVALYHVDGMRLVAAQRLGCGDAEASQPIRLTADSLLTRSVSTGRLESLMPSVPGEPNESLPFGGTPACAVAVPIVLDGATVAVVYADDADHVDFATSAPHARMKFAELVYQYAMLVLLRISVERKSGDDLRAFAASLVAELEYGYTVEAEAGRNRLECQQRLRQALQTVKRRYAERSAGDPGSQGLLEEQLAAALVAQRETAFGRDLDALIGTARSRGANIVPMFR